jgi:hypothetical protein
MSDQAIATVVAAPSPQGFAMASAAQIRDRVNRIQEVMQAVFKRDTHYGVIPGTDKPTLYKAGSEVILLTFRIAVEPIVEDLSTPDCARYRVACRGMLPTGEIVGVGIGEASTDEEKYRWRRAVCDQEFDETPEERRRSKWANRKQGNTYVPYQTKQVRTNPADVANTVLKMAKKRAQIDMTLTATAASDVFTQDIEDLPEELRETVSDDARPTMQPPKAKDADQKATEPAKDKADAENKDLDRELAGASKPAGVKVTEYKQRTGKKGNGDPWVLHIALFSDGREGTTFNDDLGALLAKSKDTGIALAVTLEPSQRDPNKLVVAHAEEVR